MSTFVAGNLRSSHSWIRSCTGAATGAIAAAMDGKMKIIPQNIMLHNANRKGQVVNWTAPLTEFHGLLLNTHNNVKTRVPTEDGLMSPYPTVDIVIILDPAQPASAPGVAWRKHGDTVGGMLREIKPVGVCPFLVLLCELEPDDSNHKIDANVKKERAFRDSLPCIALSKRQKLKVPEFGFHRRCLCKSLDTCL
eukprot:3553331-Rhodomonas_salina.1